MDNTNSSENPNGEINERLENGDKKSLKMCEMVALLVGKASLT